MAQLGNLGTSDSGGLDRFGPVSLSIEFKKDPLDPWEEPIALTLNQVQQLIIVLDIHRFLPSVNLELQDSGGYLTHLFPDDRRMRKLHIQLGKLTTGNMDDSVLFSFDVWRRTPKSEGTFQVHGLLDVDNFFSPEKIRSFNGTIKSTIQSIADEIKADSTEISSSLNYSKTLLQANWTNGQFLRWMTQELIGNDSSSAFSCFLRCTTSEKILVFKSLKDFQKSKVKYILAPHPGALAHDTAVGGYTIVQPILGWEIYDSGKLLGVTSKRKQVFSYFNYSTGTYVADEVAVNGNTLTGTDYYSMTEYYSLDKSDSENEGVSIDTTGRSNAFTSNFQGRVLSSYHKNLFAMSKVWVTTWGLQDAAPGDVVDIQKLDRQVPQQIAGLHYEGFWVIERVVHLVGNGFLTKLLLIRNGVTSGDSNTLIRASQWKKA